MLALLLLLLPMMMVSLLVLLLLVEAMRFLTATSILLLPLLSLLHVQILFRSF